MCLVLQVIGLAGLSLVLLDPLERHFILDPVVTSEEQLEDLRYDIIKDTFQFLIGENPLKQ